MIETVGSWLCVVTGAAFGTALLQILSPTVKSGLGKYVKFVSAAAVLLIVITPLFKILSELESNLDKTGIFLSDENINITESTQRDKWILSETLTSLEAGIKKLVKEKFGADIETEFDTGITHEGIEIKSVTIGSKGLIYARKLEIAAYLEDYLSIEVHVKNDAE